MLYRRLEPFLYFGLISLIWGASFLFMKKASSAFGPISIGAGRVLFGALVLGPLWFLQRKSWPLKRPHALPLALIILLGYLWPYTMQPYLVGRCGSGFIGMMVSFVPLMTLLASIPILNVYPTRRQLVGVLGGLAFIGLLLADGLKRRVQPQDLIWAASVPLAYAIANTYLKKKFTGVTSLPISFCALLLSSMCLIPLALSLPSETIKTGDSFGIALASLFALGVLGTGFAMYMFYKLIQEQGPLFAGMVTYLVPLGAILWGWLDGERVTLLQLLALGGTLAMVALVQVPSRNMAKTGNVQVLESK